MMDNTFLYVSFLCVAIGVFAGFALRVYKENGSKDYFIVLLHSFITLHAVSLIIFLITPILVLVKRKDISNIVSDAIIKDAKKPLLDREKKSLQAKIYKNFSFYKRIQLAFYFLSDFISNFDKFGAECICRAVVNHKKALESSKKKSKNKITFEYEYKESVKKSLSKISVKKGTALFPCTV